MARTTETGDDDARWALILGASTGSGAAIARSLAGDPGLNVFGIHRGHYPDEAAAAEAAVRAAGRRAIMHVADAGTWDGVQACATVLRERIGTGRIALMVHSLSGASVGHFLSKNGDAFHPKQFEKTFNYLAHSFAYWAQALYEGGLLAPGAQLLGLTNALHDQVLHNCGVIAAAKSALQSYVRYLAVELGREGHRVNLLQFGTVLTPALRTVLGPQALARMEAVHADMIPAGRMCTVEEVGRMVSLLLRDETFWFNGATIDYTGGMTLRLFDMVLQPD
jgi:NAD(P)-dependent dehydrogenase (short-subunit alcohol dehydrogenase family)